MLKSRLIKMSDVGCCILDERIKGYIIKKIFLSFIFVSSIFANEFNITKTVQLSTIPLPPVKLISLDTSSCARTCLIRLLRNGEYFSFLELFRDDEKLQKYYDQLRGVLRLAEIQSFDEIVHQSGVESKFALLLPSSVIKYYAHSVFGSMISYLIYQNKNFDIKLFDSIDESEEGIKRSIDTLKEQGYKYVIAVYTKGGAGHVIKNSSNLIVYFPTINKSDFNMPPSNILFGGIDYASQLKLLEDLISEDVVMFSYGSSVSQDIAKEVESRFNVTSNILVDPKNINFKNLLKDKKQVLDDSSLFLNTPAVLSSSIISNLRVYDIEPFALFSLQNSYNPSLFQLLQPKDLKHLLVANSISNPPINLSHINKRLNSDIKFNWVNYSSSLGMDYLYSLFDTNTSRVFPEVLFENQVEYDTKIYRASRGRFRGI